MLKMSEEANTTSAGQRERYTSSTKMKKKKNRRSDADRKRLHELEMQQKREQLLETFMKDKAQRESRFGNLNAIKLNWQWRSVLRDLKEAELRSETNALKSNFEHLIQTKDNVISVLAREADDRQLADLTSESHVQRLDDLLEMQSRHLEKMKISFEEQKSKIVVTLEREMEVDGEKHAKDVRRVVDIRAGFNMETDDWEKSVLSAYQSRQDEILNKSREDEHAVRAKLDAVIDGLRQQMKNMIADYHANTDGKRRIYEELVLRDERTSREVDDQDAKIRKLTDTIARLKRHLKSIREAGSESQQSAQNAEDRVRDKYANMTAAMDRQKMDQERRLTALSVASSEAISKLQSSIHRGRSLLKMFAMCTKYDQLHVRTGKSHPDTTSRAIVAYDNNGICSHLHVLDDFWRRYNDASVEAAEAQITKRALLLENGRLKSLLSEYVKESALETKGTNTSLQHCRMLSLSPGQK